MDRIENKLDKLKKERDNESHNELMTIKEVANYISYQKSSIYRLVQKRKIPFIKAGGKLHFRKSDIDKWLDNGKRLSRDDIKKKANKYVVNNPLF